ncbi:MAG: hypothetical protein HFH59_06600 [Lachnospiraceae bacterium]|nr:hypothetical protein [Lachnospiraceae bacterium]
MTAIKERSIGAVTVISDRDAEDFWEIIKRKLRTSWDDIEEVEPDEIDLQMLKAIEEDPECHQFTKESNINWDE